jgi:hypothetical protein
MPPWGWAIFGALFRTTRSGSGVVFRSAGVDLFLLLRRRHGLAGSDCIGAASVGRVWTLSLLVFVGLIWHWATLNIYGPRIKKSRGRTRLHAIPDLLVFLIACRSLLSALGLKLMRAPVVEMGRLARLGGIACDFVRRHRSSPVGGAILNLANDDWSASLSAGLRAGFIALAWRLAVQSFAATRGNRCGHLVARLAADLLTHMPWQNRPSTPLPRQNRSATGQQQAPPGRRA